MEEFPSLDKASKDLGIFEKKQKLSSAKLQTLLKEVEMFKQRKMSLKADIENTKQIIKYYEIIYYDLMTNTENIILNQNMCKLVETKNAEIIKGIEGKLDEYKTKLNSFKIDTPQPSKIQDKEILLKKKAELEKKFTDNEAILKDLFNKLDN